MTDLEKALSEKNSMTNLLEEFSSIFETQNSLLSALIERIKKDKEEENDTRTTDREAETEKV